MTWITATKRAKQQLREDQVMTGLLADSSEFNLKQMRKLAARSDGIGADLRRNLATDHTVKKPSGRLAKVLRGKKGTR